MKNFLKTSLSRCSDKSFLILGMILCSPILSWATRVSNLNDLDTELQGAATDIGALMGTIATIVYVVAGIVGLIGTIRIYQKWQAGDQGIQKDLINWGGCYFPYNCCCSDSSCILR